MKYYPFNVLFFLSFIVCSLFARSTSQDTLPDDYLQFSLTIFDDRLEGTSKQLEGFSLSMDVPEEFLKREFNIEDLMALVRNQEIRGTLRYPSSSGSIHAGKTTEIKYEIVRHRNGEDIYMKTSLGYFLWEHINIQNGILSFAINWWYCPPARIVDLEALEMAEQLLADPAHWHQNDDRKCDNDIESKPGVCFVR